MMTTCLRTLWPVSNRAISNNNSSSFASTNSLRGRRFACTPIMRDHASKRLWASASLRLETRGYYHRDEVLVMYNLLTVLAETCFDGGCPQPANFSFPFSQKHAFHLYQHSISDLSRRIELANTGHIVLGHY